MLHLVMSRTVRRRTLLASPAAMAATLLGCGSDPVYPTDALRIATGGRGGVYFAYGTGLADLVRTHQKQLRA